MKRFSHFLLVAVTLALSWPALGAGIDFNPVESGSVEDGIPVKRIAFRDGEKSIFFRPLKGWKMLGGGDQITFTPPAPLEGEVRLGNSPLSPSILFDEPGLIIYRAAVRKFVPVQAQNVEVLSEATDAFSLDDWKSFEMRVSYTMGGKKKVRSVLFVTMNPQRQVRLVADSNEQQFEEIYAKARALIGSWFEPPPGWPGLTMSKAP